MNSKQNGPDNGTDAAQSSQQVRCAPGVYLDPVQVALLGQAYPGEQEILVKEEFRSGYSGALVILVSVGVGRAPVVVKFAHPLDLQREYEAYETYAREVSPQNIAHLQGEPLVAPGGQMGLIHYTFAGGESHLPTTSLQAYYQSRGAEDASAVLNRIFRVFGRHWWGNNRAQSYVLDEYYDRLLPVHLQAAPADETSSPAHVIIAGETSVLIQDKVKIGQIIRLVGLEVTKVRDDGGKITLSAASPATEASAPLRVRVESLQPFSYLPGDVVESLTVEVTEKRLTLLGSAAQEALPGFDPGAAQFMLPSREMNGEGAGLVLPNPLLKLHEMLYRVVETKTSIIHGDLNLQNVLIDAPTGFAWLIDFAETRVGPTLLDLQRLEVQVITKLMPAGGEVPLEALVEMMTRLHADPPLPSPPHPALKEPYALLVTIRRLARQYLIDDMDWTEYYYGLVVVLLGALKYDELDSAAHRVVLVSAAAADSLIGRPLHTVPPDDSTQTELLVAVPPPLQAATQIQQSDVDVQTTEEPARRQQVAEPAAQAAGVANQASKTTANRKPSRGRGVGIAVAAVALVILVLAGWWIVSQSTSSENGSATADSQPASLEVSPTLEESAAAAALPAPTQTVKPTVTASAEVATDTPMPQPTTTQAATVVPAGLVGSVTPEEEALAEGDEVVVEPMATASIAPTPLPTPSPPPLQSEGATLKTLVTLNVRSGPGVEYPVVGSLGADSSTDLLGRTAGSSDVWYQVVFPQGGTERAWITGDTGFVEVSGAADVPIMTRPPIPTRAPMVALGVIYFSATDSTGQDNIYRIPVTGNTPPVLMVEEARQPVRSPDNQVLAFQSTRGNAQGVAGLNAGSQNRVLFSSSPEDSVPSWSSDGNRVVYASNREGDRNWRLYITTANSGGGSYELGLGADPDWHPSRDQIVYRGCDSSGARCGLWTVASDGTSPGPLTTNPSDARPRWSPDGRSVIFMSAERDGNWEVYQVEVATGSVKRITDHPANDGLPAISPDGRQVAFLSNRNGSWGIWSVDLSGGAPRLVVSIDAAIPDWLSQGVDWAK